MAHQRACDGRSEWARQRERQRYNVFAYIVPLVLICPDHLPVRLTGHVDTPGFYFDDEWARSGHGWAELDLVGKPLRFNASDCGTGPSEIEKHCLLDMGVSAEDVKDITLAWRNTTAAAMRAVNNAHRFFVFLHNFFTT